MAPDPPDVTSMLIAWSGGDSSMADRLMEAVYDDLRRKAAGILRRESPGHTLQPTALVHEAYLRIAKTEEDVRWDNRGHFYMAAAEAMRRILIDRARARGALKRGGDRPRLTLDQSSLTLDAPPPEILELDEALRRLESEDPVKADLVKLRFFGGLSLREAAAILGISESTADRYWAYARAWLYNEMAGEV